MTVDVTAIPNTGTRRRSHSIVPDQGDNFVLGGCSLSYDGQRLAVSAGSLTIADGDTVYAVEIGGTEFEPTGQQGVYVDVDSAGPSGEIVVQSAAPADPALQLGTVDAGAGTTTEVNREPDQSVGALSAERLLTKSRSVDAVVYETSGTWHADGDSVVASDAEFKTVVDSALSSHDHVVVKGQPSLSGTVTVPEGKTLAAVGNVRSSDQNAFGTVITASQSAALVELKDRATLAGIALRNDTGNGVKISGRKTDIVNCNIEVESKGITDEGGTDLDNTTIRECDIINYSAESGDVPASGTVGIDLTNGVDNNVFSSFVQYWDTCINVPRAAPQIKSCDIFGDGSVGIEAKNEADIHDNTVSRLDTLIRATGNNNQISDNRLEVQSNGSCIEFERGGNSLSNTIVKNNHLSDIDDSAGSTGVVFTNVSGIGFGETQIKDNVYFDIGSKGERTVETGEITLTGDGSSFLQYSHSLPDDPDFDDSIVNLVPSNANARSAAPIHIGVGIGVINVSATGTFTDGDTHSFFIELEI